MGPNLEGHPCLLSSGAPDSPVHTGHYPVPDLLPKMAKPTVADAGAVGAPDMSGAHRTVRFPLPTVGSATCPARIARPTVGPGRPLAHRTVRCTPDSPVNFSRTPPANFPRAASLSRASLAHRTLSGAHRTVRCSRPSWVLAAHSQVPSPFLYSSSFCF